MRNIQIAQSSEVLRYLDLSADIITHVSSFRCKYFGRYSISLGDFLSVRWHGRSLDATHVCNSVNHFCVFPDN